MTKASYTVIAATGDAIASPIDVAASITFMADQGASTTSRIRGTIIPHLIKCVVDTFGLPDFALKVDLAQIIHEITWVPNPNLLAFTLSVTNFVQTQHPRRKYCSYSAPSRNTLRKKGLWAWPSSERNRQGRPSQWSLSAFMNRPG